MIYLFARKLSHCSFFYILEEGATGDGGMFMGEVIEDRERASGESSFGVNVGVSMAAAAAVTLATGGLFGAIAGLAVFGFGAASSVEAEKRRKRSYECNGCQAVRTSTLRYRCGLVVSYSSVIVIGQCSCGLVVVAAAVAVIVGNDVKMPAIFCRMCEDFTLCPSCFEDSRHGFQLHNSQHFFLKLKFQQRRHLPPGGVLKPKVCENISACLQSYVTLNKIILIKIMTNIIIK